MTNQNTIFGSSIVPFRLVFFMWLCFYFEIGFGVNLNFLGIKPREAWGLIGIVTAPLIHGDIIHLISNTVPMLFLGSVLFFFYRKIAGEVFFRAYFWTNMLVWVFGRTSNHIGASGVVYGIAFFLIAFGLMRRDFLSLFISVVVILLYGGIIYGVLPTNPQVSWESHLGGALVGIYSAKNFSKQRVIR
jgi:membrane associated rhomboid family serine protease